MGSHARQRLGRRHAGGAKGGPKSGNGADQHGSPDAAAPGEDWDDNELVLGGGIDGRGENADPDADRAS